MDIAKHTGYFHDGGFIGAKRKKNNMELFLRSCEISSDEPIDRKILSEKNALKGKLCLMGVKWIKVDGKEDKEIPWKEYDDGEILDLEIDNNKVFLLIEWTNFPPKSRINDIGKIEIEAEKIYWENIPNLPDNYCDEDL
jgi:hypothetical protein